LHGFFIPLRCIQNDGLFMELATDDGLRWDCRKGKRQIPGLPESAVVGLLLQAG